MEFEAIFEGSRYVCEMTVDDLTGNPIAGGEVLRQAFERRRTEIEKAIRVALIVAQEHSIVHQPGIENKPIRIVIPSPLE
jgi:hypothetical protein